MWGKKQTMSQATGQRWFRQFTGKDTEIAVKCAELNMLTIIHNE